MQSLKKIDSFRKTELHFVMLSVGRRGVTARPGGHPCSGHFTHVRHLGPHETEPPPIQWLGGQWLQQQDHVGFTHVGDSAHTWAMKPEEERAGLLLTTYILNLIILYRTRVLSLMTSSFVWPDSQTPSEAEPALREAAVQFSAVSSISMQVLAFTSLSEGEETTVWATEKRDQFPLCSGHASSPSGCNYVNHPLHLQLHLFLYTVLRSIFYFC